MYRLFHYLKIFYLWKNNSILTTVYSLRCSFNKYNNFKFLMNMWWKIQCRRNIRLEKFRRTASMQIERICQQFGFQQDNYKVVRLVIRGWPTESIVGVLKMLTEKGKLSPRHPHVFHDFDNWIMSEMTHPILVL